MHLTVARRTRLYGFLCLGVIVLACSALLLRQIQQPVRAGDITTPPPATTTVAQDIPVHGIYANFSYPNTLHPLSTGQGPVGDIVAVYNYERPDLESWHLAITINQLANPMLTDDSGYLLRQNNPTRYQASTLTIGNNVFTIMTDTQAGGFSQVAFILHGSYSADISLTGDDPTASTLQGTFQQILQSWQWKI